MSQVVSLKYLRVLKYVHRYYTQVAEPNGNFYFEQHALERNYNSNDSYKYILVDYWSDFKYPRNISLWRDINIYCV